MVSVRKMMARIYLVLSDSRSVRNIYLQKRRLRKLIFDIQFSRRILT